MCQHNLPCSIVLPTACFPEGPSPHFTLCSFWRRRPRLEAVAKKVSKSKFSDVNRKKESLELYTRDVRNELLIVLYLDIHMGNDKNQYIPI